MLDEEIESAQKFVHFSDRGDIWKDVDRVPQFSDNVEILKIDYDDITREINDYFRAILHNKEISERAFMLTKEVIGVRNNLSN
jgi:hypothetical protein